MNKQQTNRSFNYRTNTKDKNEDFSHITSIYYMYLAGFFTFYISSLIGYMKAFRERKNTNNSIIMNSHYRYQLRVMNINMILGLVVMLSSTAYIFYIISNIDFMNVDISDNGLMSQFTNVISFWTISSVFINILFYAQTLWGLKAIKKMQQI